MNNNIQYHETQIFYYTTYKIIIYNKYAKCYMIGTRFIIDRSQVKTEETFCRKLLHNIKNIFKAFIIIKQFTLKIRQ